MSRSEVGDTCRWIQRDGGVLNENDLKSVKTVPPNGRILTSGDTVEHHRRSRNSAEDSPRVYKEKV